MDITCILKERNLKLRGSQWVAQCGTDSKWQSCPPRGGLTESPPYASSITPRCIPKEHIFFTVVQEWEPPASDLR